MMMKQTWRSNSGQVRVLVVMDPFWAVYIRAYNPIPSGQHVTIYIETIPSQSVYFPQTILIFHYTLILRSLQLICTGRSPADRLLETGGPPKKLGVDVDDGAFKPEPGVE